MEDPLSTLSSGNSCQNLKVGMLFKNKAATDANDSDIQSVSLLQAQLNCSDGWVPCICIYMRSGSLKRKSSFLTFEWLQGKKKPKIRLTFCCTEFQAPFFILTANHFNFLFFFCWANDRMQNVSVLPVWLSLLKPETSIHLLIQSMVRVRVVSPAWLCWDTSLKRQKHQKTICCSFQLNY